MTRQKKELIRKIEEIERFIEADDALGCGFAPAGFYDPLYSRIYRLQKELATLRHYDTVMDMLYDFRGCENEGIPFA